MADYFGCISQEFTPIRPPDMTAEQERVPSPSVSDILMRIMKMRKPRTQVTVDIDPRLLKRYPHLLALPLSIIFDKVFKTNCWPSQWTSKTVTLIPKKNTPETEADLPNLSCTPFFSKLQETFLLDHLKAQVELSKEQFGGKKGLGVDHLLIEIWDYVHRSLETPGAAVGLMAIDFHKAFNKMSHQACVESLAGLGAYKHIIALTSNFLEGRNMRVKIGDTLGTRITRSR